MIINFQRKTCFTVLAAALLAISGCSKKKSATTTSAPNTNHAQHAAFASINGAHGAAPKKPQSAAAAKRARHLKLAFVSNNVAEYWNYAHAGIRKFEKKTGIQVAFKEPRTGAVAEQNSILEDLASAGYNGVAVSVIAPHDQVVELNRIAQHMKLICVDSDSPQSHRLMYIGTNNYNAGKLMGKQIDKLLPKGGQMAVFVGSFAADNARQRLKGILYEIKGKHIRIVAKKEDQTDAAKARSNVEDVLVAFPHVNLLCGLYSYNGPAIAGALKGAHKQGKIKAVVFDQDPQTLLGIKQGVINCTIVQNPVQEGYLSCVWLERLCMNRNVQLPKTKHVDTGVEVVDAKNVASYQKKLAKMTK